MMIRPFLNDRPDCGRGVCRTLTPWPGTPSIWQKKYSTITRGDVISYCPSDVDDTNTQHMIRYKHAGTQRSDRATLTGVGLSQRVVRLVDEEPTFFVYAPWPFLTARPHASLFSAYCMYSSSQSRICIVLFCKYIGNTRHTSKPLNKKKVKKKMIYLGTHFL